ncbi:MAG: hypothetical protein JST00_45965 [Deltaproteobacteria bacterium]|nr:hypothetical protein [Deltaproteobacteria bacterium]
MPSRSPFEGRELAFVAVDLGVARAFWEGVPTARLLARIRLDRDERDLVGLAARASGADVPTSSWDVLAARLLAESPASFERVKRAVARHGRAATDEGPLSASDETIAALVVVLLSSNEDGEMDASPAEGWADARPVETDVLRACGRLDYRLADRGADRRAAPFEACVLLTSFARSKPTSAALLGPMAALALPTPFYPRADEESPDVPESDRRMILVDRGALVRTLATDERLQQKVGPVLSQGSSIVAVPITAPMSTLDVPAVPPSSWMPAELGTVEGAARLASALERGATTAPRVRALVLRGGDAALDAIGREMLEVANHPFASAVFADILGRRSRERDVVRLVSYFAIAPDPAPAAHALAVCAAPEVTTVLRAWLESLVRDAAPAPAFAVYVGALAPYPHLAAAVKPLVAKLDPPGGSPT